MLKQILFSAALLALILFLNQITHAQQFYDNGMDHSLFCHDFGEFTANLDTVPYLMRSSYDQSNMMAAHRSYLNALTNRIDTMAAAQQAFQNTQATMIYSGGAYNNQGFIWGAPPLFNTGNGFGSGF